MPWFIQDANNFTLHIRVKPGSHNTKIIGVVEDYLVIALRAKAVEGAANQALIEFLSDYLKIPKRDIVILKGEHSRFKTIQINGCKADILNNHLSSGCKIL